MEKGSLIGADISSDVGKAASEYRKIKKRGETLESALRQIDMFNPLPKEVSDILNIFAKYSRSGKKIGNALARYVEIWEGIGDPRQTSIFGDPKTYSKRDILARTIKEIGYENDKTPMVSLFGGESKNVPIAGEAKESQLRKAKREQKKEKLGSASKK